MKKIILIAVLALMTIPASAQEKGFTAYLGFGNSGGWRQRFLPFDMTISAGYNFTPNFYTELITDYSVSLFEISGVQSHYLHGIVGLGAGYYLWKSKDSRHNVALELSAASTLEKLDWRFMRFGGDVRFNFGERIKMTTAVGVRYYNSYTDAFPNAWKFFVSLGFRIN